MGAYLSQPIKDKETEDGCDDSGLRWGAAGMQGWRTGMEDSYLACVDLSASGVSAASSNSNTLTRRVAAFAIFDGHGGAEVAQYCSTHMCDVLTTTKAFQDGKMGLGLRQSFLRMDDLLRTPAGQAELLSLKKAGKSGDSGSDESEEELMEMNAQTHMQIVEQMKTALKEQFVSEGKVVGEMENDAEDGDDSCSVDDGDSESSMEDDPTKSGVGTANADSLSSTMDTSSASVCDSTRVSTFVPEPLTNVAVLHRALDSDAKKKEAHRVAPSLNEAVECGNEAAGEWDRQGSPDNGIKRAVARGKAMAEQEVEESAADPAADDPVEDTVGVNIEGADASGNTAFEQRSHRRCAFDCGATAVMALLVGDETLVVANAGDSRCVLSRKGAAIDMSIDHKPEDEEELARIEKAGGAVVDGRVQGNLNLSRAIGDLMYKSDEDLSPEAQMITANPDIRTLEVEEDDEFIVLACDGVWNSLSSQETIDFVRERLKGAAGRSVRMSSICADLCDACCAESADGDGTGLDNVTAVIVALRTAAALDLVGSGGGNPGTGSSSEGEESGEVNSSDDAKRKQGGDEGQGGSKRPSRKQMRSTLGAAA